MGLSSHISGLFVSMPFQVSIHFLFKLIIIRFILFFKYLHTLPTCFYLFIHENLRCNCWLLFMSLVSYLATWYSYPVIHDYLPFLSLFSVVRNRKRAVAVGSSLKSNKKVSSLVDKASFFKTKSIYVFLVFFEFHTLDYFLFNMKLILDVYYY